MIGDKRVNADRSRIRDSYDVERQTVKHMIKAITISIIGTLTIIGVASEFFVSSPELLLLLMILLGIVFMGSIIFYFRGRMTTKMNYAHQGYNVNWDLKRQMWFGREEYRIVRVDAGNLQNMIMGFNGNPFAAEKRELQKIEESQRDDAVCSKCSTDLEFAFSDDGGAYFVETRIRYWFLGLPIREKIVDWEEYCPDHRPHDLLPDEP